jgi:hypothetical protein
VNPRWLILFLLCVAAVANAQSAKSDLRVLVVNVDGSPVAGALVALLDGNNQVVAEGLSSETGLRLLPASAGTYKVRVRRIGFTPFVSESVSIPRSGSLTLRVESTRISLGTIVVTARGQCRQMASDEGTLATVWAEIVKALQASQFTVADLAGVGRARLFTKEIGTRGEIVRADSSTVTLTNRRPFGIIDPGSLARLGYARGDIYSGFEFFGPDEGVLLSPEFARTHCFTVVRDATRQGEVGLGFKPSGNRKVADIQGVLWLDEKSSELRDMVFEYTNTGLPRRIRAGGQTRFRRFPSGAWLVEEWKLSMPRVETHRRTIEQFGVNDSDFVLVGFTETGGSLFLDSSSISRATGSTSVAGVIFDSLNMKPLRGAGVTLNDVTVRSDKEGRFRFAGVPFGAHSISFSHPILRSLGLIAIESEFETTTAETELHLTIPSLRAVWPRLCHDTASTRAGDDRRGVLHGAVRDAAGRPVDRARVRITWREEVSLRDLRGMARFQRPDLKLEVVTDNSGKYAACGFSSKTRGIVEVIVGNRLASRTGFDFAQGPVVERDLALPENTPMRSADTVAIRYLETLERNGFYRRRAVATAGIFITAEEIRGRKPPRITELLRDIPGIDVISPRGSSDNEDFPATEETGCPLTLLVNGKPAHYRTDDLAVSTDTFAALVPPDVVVGLEVYTVSSAVPKQFGQTAGGCGLIVVWTRSR